MSGVSETATHLLELLIRCELHRRIRNNAYAVGSIPSHEPLETFFFPHTDE